MQIGRKKTICAIAVVVLVVTVSGIVLPTTDRTACDPLPSSPLFSAASSGDVYSDEVATSDAGAASADDPQRKGSRQQLMSAPENISARARQTISPRRGRGC